MEDKNEIIEEEELPSMDKSELSSTSLKTNSNSTVDAEYPRCEFYKKKEPPGIINKHKLKKCKQNRISNGTLVSKSVTFLDNIATIYKIPKIKSRKYKAVKSTSNISGNKRKNSNIEDVRRINKEADDIYKLNKNTHLDVNKASTPIISNKTECYNEKQNEDFQTNDSLISLENNENIEATPDKEDENIENPQTIDKSDKSISSVENEHQNETPNTDTHLQASDYLETLGIIGNIEDVSEKVNDNIGNTDTHLQASDYLETLGNIGNIEDVSEKGDDNIGNTDTHLQASDYLETLENIGKIEDVLEKGDDNIDNPQPIDQITESINSNNIEPKNENPNNDTNNLINSLITLENNENIEATSDEEAENIENPQTLDKIDKPISSVENKHQNDTPNTDTHLQASDYLEALENIGKIEDGLEKRDENIDNPQPIDQITESINSNNIEPKNENPNNDTNNLINSLITLENNENIEATPDEEAENIENPQTLDKIDKPISSVKNAENNDTPNTNTHLQASDFLETLENIGNIEDVSEKGDDNIGNIDTHLQASDYLETLENIGKIEDVLEKGDDNIDNPQPIDQITESINSNNIEPKNENPNNDTNNLINSLITLENNENIEATSDEEAENITNPQTLDKIDKPISSVKNAENNDTPNTNTHLQASDYLETLENIGNIEDVSEKGDDNIGNTDTHLQASDYLETLENIEKIEDVLEKGDENIDNPQTIDQIAKTISSNNIEPKNENPNNDTNNLINSLNTLENNENVEDNPEKEADKIDNLQTIDNIDELINSVKIEHQNEMPNTDLQDFDYLDTLENISKIGDVPRQEAINISSLKNIDKIDELLNSKKNEPNHDNPDKDTYNTRNSLDTLNVNESIEDSLEKEGENINNPQTMDKIAQEISSNKNENLNDNPFKDIHSHVIDSLKTLLNVRKIQNDPDTEDDNIGNPQSISEIAEPISLRNKAGKDTNSEAIEPANTLKNNETIEKPQTIDKIFIRSNKIEQQNDAQEKIYDNISNPHPINIISQLISSDKNEPKNYNPDKYAHSQAIDFFKNLESNEKIRLAPQKGAVCIDYVETIDKNSKPMQNYKVGKDTLSQVIESFKTFKKNKNIEIDLQQAAVNKCNPQTIDESSKSLNANKDEHNNESYKNIHSQAINFCKNLKTINTSDKYKHSPAIKSDKILKTNDKTEIASEKEADNIDNPQSIAKIGKSISSNKNEHQNDIKNKNTPSQSLDSLKTIENDGNIRDDNDMDKIINNIFNQNKKSLPVPSSFKNLKDGDDNNNDSSTINDSPNKLTYIPLNNLSKVIVKNDKDNTNIKDTNLITNTTGYIEIPNTNMYIEEIIVSLKSIQSYVENNIKNNTNENKDCINNSNENTSNENNEKKEKEGNEISVETNNQTKCSTNTFNSTKDKAKSSCTIKFKMMPENIPKINQMEKVIHNKKPDHPVNTDDIRDDKNNLIDNENKKTIIVQEANSLKNDIVNTNGKEENENDFPTISLPKINIENSIIENIIPGNDIILLPNADSIKYISDEPRMFNNKSTGNDNIDIFSKNSFFQAISSATEQLISSENIQNDYNSNSTFFENNEEIFRNQIPYLQQRAGEDKYLENTNRDKNVKINEIPDIISDDTEILQNSDNILETENYCFDDILYIKPVQEDFDISSVNSENSIKYKSAKNSPIIVIDQNNKNCNYYNNNSYYNNNVRYCLENSNIQYLEGGQDKIDDKEDEIDDKEDEIDDKEDKIDDDTGKDRIDRDTIQLHGKCMDDISVNETCTDNSSKSSKQKKKCTTNYNCNKDYPGSCIVETDMTDKLMKHYAISVTNTAFKKMERGCVGSAAAYIRRSFDTLYGASWNCVVGDIFDVSFAHDKKTYAHLKRKNKMIVLYKINVR